MDDKDRVNFDFLFVVPGVAIGLAIVRVCQFLGYLFVYRSIREWTQFPELWMVLWSFGLLAYTAQYWFFSSRRRELRAYAKSFSAYLCVMVMPILISFMSFVLCPELDEPAFQDLGNHFEMHSPLLYLLIGLSMWAATVESFVMRELRSQLSYPSENYVRTIVGGIFVAAWLEMTVFPLDLAIDKDLAMALVSILLILFRLAMCKWPV